MARRTKWAASFMALLLVITFDGVPTEAARGEDFVNPMKHDIFLITGKNFDNLISRYRNNDGVAMLLHFHSKDSSIKSFIEGTYNPVAQELKGIVRMGAIDCGEWTMFCKDNMNPDVTTPLLVVYPPNPVPPFILQETDKKSISSTALRQIPAGHVRQLDSQTVDGFLTESVSVPKVLLFSNKEKPPVIFRALSSAFKDRLSFGFVPSKETTLTSRYKVKKFPTILVLKAAVKGSGFAAPEVYSGKMTYEALHDWLNVRAETFVKGGGFSDVIHVEETPRPWLVQPIPELTGPSHQDICFKGSSLCVVYLTNGRISPEDLMALERTSQKYGGVGDRGVAFKWMWADVQVEEGLRELFGIGRDTALPSAVVINPHKRPRFMGLSHDTTATMEAIEALLEKIAAGGARFTIIKGGKLPAFAARTPEGQPVAPGKPSGPSDEL